MHKLQGMAVGVVVRLAHTIPVAHQAMPRPEPIAEETPSGAHMEAEVEGVRMAVEEARILIAAVVVHMQVEAVDADVNQNRDCVPVKKW